MNYNIIQSVTTSVLKLLKDDLKRNNIKGVECLNRQPNAQKLADKMPCGLFYLYGISENQELKERDPYQVRDKDADGNTYEFLREAPIKLDLNYLLCAYAEDPDMEHKILGRCILTLYDNSELSKLGDLKELARHPSDRIGLRMLPISREEQVRFWSSLQEAMRPAAFYEITVRMESERQRKFRRVEERVLDIRQKE
ncbi:MAG: DUF4255 domain-containing protein [candidate division Zixibacteria bacterium]|jgi:hypothetical protein|nr:DUF4255 domain-containing protein [candidate division Zixibacteria bacterium]NIS15889.1 DUF4255 domain-containing protein [candidate division Zixibacteria bacterium]NIS44856.1 DUF4255 domain-containing protein [candidate division Zixibacteria bacterium]NIT52338.1 DUF4255 domain-containing protein [candidate division Zixibacteria bacterium]NIU12949.1 DUF4255 domain-containing protein [candidate division Zixibacteria bacterium]